MGFLNHATNNIIVDAVLTDLGREYLARNDGSFKISRFRVGDDEVDYSLIEQYGIALGKEKIEKNTPIFEAITHKSLAIKYPLVTLSNNTTTVFAYPSIVLDGLSLPITLSTYEGVGSQASNINFKINVKTTINQDSNFDLNNANLVDEFFKVVVVNDLLKVTNFNIIHSQDEETTTFRIPAQSLNSTSEFKGQITGTFEITAAGVADATSFKYYSLETDNTTIHTQIQVIGNKSNAILTIPVIITSNKI